MLICLGAALFTVVSIYGFPGSDPARIAAGVVTGIGFIGAGVILHRTGGAVSRPDHGGDDLGGGGHRYGGRRGHVYHRRRSATVLVLVILLLPHIHKPPDNET